MIFTYKHIDRILVSLTTEVIMFNSFSPVFIYTFRKEYITKSELCNCQFWERE
jgi:hypothetical protein